MKNSFISPGPANSLEEILSRFKADFEKVKKDNLSLVIDLYNHREEGRYTNKISPKECPNYPLIVAGALLTKVIEPEKIEYLDEILCGHREKQVNTLGPLSGREGTEYKPLSQCWRTAAELKQLVLFMKKREKIPASPNSKANEEEKRKILNERHIITTRNEQRQMVFTDWNKLRPGVSSLLATKKNQLKLPVSTGISNETGLVEQTVDVYDQINVGGLAYQELTDWINRQVLIPLKNLVGKDYCYYRTSQSCPKAPKEHFFGVMS